MSKEKKQRKIQVRSVRSQLEGRLNSSLVDWRARLDEKKFHKIVKKAAKTLAESLVESRSRSKTAPGPATSAQAS
jgi:hypothetical protein